MSDKTTQDRWNREEWAQDNRETEHHDEESTPVWNRHQVEPDEYASDESAGQEPADTEDDSGPLSGHGKPSGEQHWDRVDES